MEKFLSRNSIQCGSFIFKPKGAEQFIKRCVRKVLFEDVSDPWLNGFIGAGGTATCLKINGEKFACITKHQIGLGYGDTPNSKLLGTVKIVEVQGDGIASLTFNQVVYTNNDETEEYADILLLGAASKPNKIVDWANFFPVRRFNRNNVRRSVIVAVPRMPDEFTLNSENVTEHITFSTAFKDCWRDHAYLSRASHVERFSYQINTDIPEDGWSGGAVFSLIQETQGLEFVFDGLITRASGGKLHTVGHEFFCTLNR